jgi:hypothetical protein
MDNDGFLASGELSVSAAPSAVAALMFLERITREIAESPCNGGALLGWWSVMTRR